MPGRVSGRTIPPHIGSVLMLGAVSQVTQIVLLRELLMIFHGNELSIGIILAAWMAWVGVGSALGAAIAGRSRRVLDVLLLNAAVLLPVLLLTVTVIRGLRGFYDVLPGAYLSLVDIIAGSLLVMAPACLLIGMQFVLLARLWRDADRSEHTGGAGKTYIGEAIGSILGGLAFTFVMVRHLSSFQSVALAGLLVAAAVLWCAQRSETSVRPARPLVRSVVIALLVTAGVALAGLGTLDQWAYQLQWRQLAPDHVLLEVHQSKYGNIAIARRDDQYSFFRSGHLMFATAGPETREPQFEAQEAAVFAHFAMTQHPRPAEVLLIGGGLRGTLAEIIRHPVERVDYVELDPVLTRAALPHLPGATRAALADPRVRLVHSDGRVYVRQASRGYDLVIIDVPDPATAVLNRFYTREFFGQVNALLNPGGLLAIAVVSTPGLRGGAVANRNATLHHTLGSVFGEVLPVGDRFLVFLASDAPGLISTDPAGLRRRYLEREVRSPAFSPHHFQLLLEDGQLRRVNWILRSHGRSSTAQLTAPEAAPLPTPTVYEQKALEAGWPPVNERAFINSDFRPIGYFYTLMFWGDLTRAGSAEPLRRLLHVQAWWVLPPIGALLLLALALRVVGRRPDRQFAVGLAVFTTGLSTMALQVALLFSFQSVYGFIYEMVGLVVAIFMAGLAAGTATTHRSVKRKANTGLLAAVQLAIAAAATLIAILLPPAAAVESAVIVFALFSTLTFAAGFLNGVDFPLATECFRALNRRAERSAGLVYGLELAGACVGAAIASAVVAPIIGITACCVLAAAANATACAALLVSRTSDGG